MSLKDRARSQAFPKGFEFARPGFHQFGQLDEFRRELRTQAASTELIDASALSALDLDGRVLGIEDDALRLTDAAFGQLCHLTKLPRTFVEQLARRNEQLALEVVGDAVVSMLNRVEDKVMVVDTRTKTVHALVDRHSYNLVSNETVLDHALSANKHAKLNRGFVSGPNARITIVNPNITTSPKVGDVVCIGTDITTDVGAETLLTTRAYNERLSCSNGMTVRDREYVEKVSARQDVESELPDVILRSFARGQKLGPMMAESAKLYLGERAVERMVEYLTDPSVGGSHKLMQAAVKGAQFEARRDDRDEGDLTLWDFVNGVTAAAKDATTLNRRINLEGLGYQVMARFVSLGKD